MARGNRREAIVLDDEDLESLRKNDWRKRVIGRAVRRNTTVPAAWISEQLRITRLMASVGKERGFQRILVLEVPGARRGGRGGIPLRRPKPCLAVLARSLVLQAGLDE